ncbi:HAMP domain-containing sensor histidine kinase [Croceicoccus sp. Ery15]|uniref:sensor histidine kinase n=1 Tax=Croceicoccus sp. Ery15 TaxID=1703338 RepID=UPI001E39ABA8|nr:HAMP domain-containing sensor histidine kinase [Croceicoccus sp. Ery15]
MKSMVKSLSFRLAVTYAALFCGSLAVLFIAYFWLAVSRPLGAVRTQVNAELAEFEAVYAKDGIDALAERLDTRAKASSALDRAFHALIAADGAVITTNLPSWPSTVQRGFYSIEADVYLEGGEIDFSSLSRERLFPDGTRLIVGRDVDEVEDREEVVLATFPILIVLVLLLAVAGGYLMTRAIGHRIDSISAAARKVMAGRLGERVPLHGGGDDFDRLSHTLNLMLERNEALFDSVRRVSDNIAHELRTPLSRVRATLDEAQLDRGGALATAREELARLQAIIDATLRIARIEGGRHDSGFATVDLAEIVSDAVELYEPAAALRHLKISVEGPATLSLSADRDLLFQAISNLLDNAVKYSVGSSEIRMALFEDEDRARLEIANEGLPLEAAEAEQVTERFFRGAAASDLPGHGLGLTLVAAIVQRHDGAFQIHATGPNTRVGISLRRQHSADAANLPPTDLKNSKTGNFDAICSLS